MSSRTRTILLIGATSGIGGALARHFHNMDKKVMAVGRNKAGLAALPAIVTQILKDFRNLDTVFINGGMQKCYNLFDPSTTTADAIIAEITTNLTAPNLLVQLFAPYLLARAKSMLTSIISITSSSLAYAPLAFTRHTALQRRGIHRRMKGGKDKAFPPLDLADYIDQFFASLEQVAPDGSIKKEIGVGFGEMGAGLWRSTFEKVYEETGLTV
ncbi:hypothetical protein F5X98DRAFT_368664 [Xylaria grammica]|nr:hypothetical protein F5X98DRAFT_368664 [Xylaria grammica]